MAPASKHQAREIRALRGDLETAMRRQKWGKAEALLEELEELDGNEARWPHKLGDVLRRLNRKQEAVSAYARAATIYAHGGFLPRAVAMAKVVLQIDPDRLDVLERVDPGAARDLHRRMRPLGAPPTEAGTATDAALQLDPVGDAGDDEVRFCGTGDRQTLELDMSEVELADRPPQAPENFAPPSESETAQPAPPSPVDPEDHTRQLEAERQACLPLLPLFAEVPREALLTLVREAELIRRTDGEVVVRRGEPADALFGIVDGSVVVHVVGLSREARPRLGAGDIFGESCLLGNEPRGADVVAEDELTALRIPKQTLNHLVRIHDKLADVLFQLLARRLVANLLHTSRLFGELSPLERREVAAEFELRRARVDTDLLLPSKQSDGLYITLTGHVEITDATGGETTVEGAGIMFGHASMLDDGASPVQVRTRDTLLVLRLPRQAFSRVAMQYPAILMRVTELDPVARITG